MRAPLQLRVILAVVTVAAAGCGTPCARLCTGWYDLLELDACGAQEISLEERNRCSDDFRLASDEELDACDRGIDTLEDYRALVQDSPEPAECCQVDRMDPFLDCAQAAIEDAR